MTQCSFEIVQTQVRQAFDPETVSVVVGKIPHDENYFNVSIRDELTQTLFAFNVSTKHTLGDLQNFIGQAVEALKLVAGPDFLADEVATQNAEAANSEAPEETPTTGPATIAADAPSTGTDTNPEATIASATENSDPLVDAGAQAGSSAPTESPESDITDGATNAAA